MDGTVEILGPECRGSHLQNKLPICLLSWSSVSSFSTHARLHPQYYPGRPGTCQLFLQHVLLINFLISFMLLTDEVGYSWWHHKLPESPSLSRCQPTWNCSITKLAMIFSKYVDGHSSRHIYTSSFHLSACNSALSCSGPNVWNHRDILGAYWNQFTNKHYSMNRHILFDFIYFQNKMGHATRHFLFYTKSTSEKWYCVYQKYSMCVMWDLAVTLLLTIIIGGPWYRLSCCRVLRIHLCTF